MTASAIRLDVSAQRLCLRDLIDVAKVPRQHVEIHVVLEVSRVNDWILGGVRRADVYTSTR